jgi:hypothetical protein
LVANGSQVNGGDIIGEVQETTLVLHKIMVPAGVSGKIDGLREGGTRRGGLGQEAGCQASRSCPKFVYKFRTGSELLC